MQTFDLTRRGFLGGATALAACAAATARGANIPLRIGVTDWNLDLGASTDAVAKASELGFRGVQVSFGRKLVDGKLPVDNAETIARYLAMSKKYNLPIDGTCVDKLHDNGLKSDPLGAKWVLDSIRLTKQLGVKVLLLPFFGRWALQTQAEKEHVGDALREIAPEAAKAGVILGLEDTISAEDNVRIMDRARAKNVLVYYDVGNSTKAGFDIVKEIRWLGKERICQIHLKDNPHLLGEGSIQFPPVIQAIKDIGWNGWANLETDARKGKLDADLKQNLAFVNRIVDETYG